MEGLKFGGAYLRRAICVSKLIGLALQLEVLGGAYFRNFTVSFPGGGTLGISGWGCAAGSLEPLTFTRTSSAEFCYPILE